MIVKPQTFRKDGRYPTASARAEYLERNGRAVETAAWNINDEEHWSCEMDKTTGQHACRGAVVGREYVLSLSPDDLATSLQVRDFALEWAARNFPASEAAIVVHTDNKECVAAGREGIPHAHVYVSAVDLETGKKVQLSNARVRDLHDSAQRVCAKRGWSAQVEYWDEKAQRVRYVESQRSAFDRRPQWQRSARLSQESARGAERVGKVREFEASAAARGGIDHHEYRAAKEGRTLDKTEIRRGLKEAAREVGENPNVTLKDALKRCGIVMEPASNGDYKYRLEGRHLQFRGRTLGPQFSRGALQASIVAARELARVADRSLERDAG